MLRLSRQCRSSVIRAWAACWCCCAFLTLAVELRTEKKLRKAVKQHPLDPEAHLELSGWHLTWAEAPKALEALQHALRVDPANAWRYHERLGDLQYGLLKDLVSAETSYAEAMKEGADGNWSILRYGTLLTWKGAQRDADRLFAKAIADGRLRSASQRPEAELLPELPADQGFWFQPSAHRRLESASELLLALLPAAQGEYQKWATGRPKDAEHDESLASDPKSTGRHVHFWIHRPRMDKGIWRDACSYKAPKTCATLKQINASGLLVYRASFDVLEPGAAVRPQCHHTNRELFIELVLEASEDSAAALTGSGDSRTRSVGELRVLDPSFEHSEMNKKGGRDRVLLRLVVRHPEAKWRPGDEEAWWEVLLRRAKWKARNWLLWVDAKLQGRTIHPWEL